MAQADNKAFPTLFQNPDGSWDELPWQEAMKRAEQTGELYNFKTEEEAKQFAEGAWKPKEANYEAAGEINYKDIPEGDFRVKSPAPSPANEDWRNLGFNSEEEYKDVISRPAGPAVVSPQEQVAQGKTDIEPESKVRILQSSVNQLQSSGLTKLKGALPQTANIIMPEIVTEALAETTQPTEVIKEVAKVDKKAANNPLVFAQKYLGIDEKDPVQQKTIKGFFDKAVPGWLKKAGEVMDDSRAWCAAFVNNILTEGGFQTLSTKGDNFNLIRARQYARIGNEVENINEAKPGDIIVVKDTTGTGGYHVAFYSGEKNGVPLMLGGNQDGRLVNVKEIDTDSLSIVSIRRINNIEDIDEDSLKEITSSKYYSSKNKKSNFR